MSLREEAEEQSSKNTTSSRINRAHKGLTNHCWLCSLLISPLPYLAISSLNPGFSWPFPSQFWVLFLPSLSSATSSPSCPMPAFQALSCFSATPDFWLGFTLTSYLWLSCSSKLAKLVFTLLPTTARTRNRVCKLERTAREHQPSGELAFVTRKPRWKCTPCDLFSSKPECFCLECLFVSQVTKKPLVPIMCHYGGVSRDSAAKVNLRCTI